MKLYYLLVLLGLILCQEKNDNYTIYDLNLNEQFIIDTKIFPEGYIPSNTSFYFRIEVNSKYSC